MEDSGDPAVLVGIDGGNIFFFGDADHEDGGGLRTVFQIVGGTGEDFDIPFGARGFEFQATIKPLPEGARAGEAEVGHFLFGGDDASLFEEGGGTGGGAGLSGGLEADAAFPFVSADGRGTEEGLDDSVDSESLEEQENQGLPETNSPVDVPGFDSEAGDQSTNDPGQETEKEGEPVSDDDEVGEREKLGEQYVVPDPADVAPDQENIEDGDAINEPDRKTTSKVKAREKEEEAEGPDQEESEGEIIHTNGTARMGELPTRVVKPSRGTYVGKWVSRQSM